MLHLGKTEGFLVGPGLLEVYSPVLGYVASTGPRCLGLAVDRSHAVFESDETNNLLVEELPFVPDEANRDEDLNGWVDAEDLFQFARNWQGENPSVLDRYGLDFGQLYFVGSFDLVELLKRWHEVTLPTGVR